MSKQAPPKYHEPVQGTVYHGDGREEALLKHLLSLPQLSSDQTSSLSLMDRSQRVLDAIHEFGKGENRYLMSVGETKGKQVEQLIKDKKPKLFLEVGAYVGFSGVEFSRHISAAYPADKFKYPSQWTASDKPGERVGYVSLEKSKVYAKTAQGAFDLAGLGDIVKFVLGSSTPNLRSLRQTLNMPAPLQFDMIFLDHLKPLYTVDIKVMEEEGLIGPGTVIVADNVVKPGNPAYLSYVRATPSQKRTALSQPRLSTQPPTTPNPTTDDAWNTAFRDGPLAETRWTPDEADGVSADGVPELQYSSEMLDGWDPYTGEKDACEVSICKGKE